jgi:transcriptional regulator
VVLPSGSVDILLLKALSWGPMHGFAISRWVRERSDDALTLEDAALYQGLHRLHRQGAIESEWGPSENNRRARYYKLTTAGRRQLREETAEWRALAQALFQVLDARSAGT